MNKEEPEMRVSNNEVIRHPLHYVHTTSVIYPKKNVNLMLKAWNESKEESSEFLKTQAEMFDNALKNGYDQIDTTYNNVVARIAEMDLLSVEDRAAKLEKEYQEYKKSSLDTVADKEQEKEKLKLTLENQTLMHTNKHKKNIKDMKEAINLWSNPIIEKEDSK